MSTLGTFGGSVIATEDASVYAVDAASGAHVAGRNASLSTWGTATNILVTGTDSASVWSYGAFNGEVSSSGGSASLITIGNAHAATVTAATDAAVLTAGDFQGWISAGDFGAVIALNGFSGSLTAGGDAVVMSGTTLDGTASAGNDLFLTAYGDLTGTFTAGHDAAAASWGSIDASISAARDLQSVWSIGGIAGNYFAGEGIGQIDTYGGINATITAPAAPTTRDPNAAYGISSGTIEGITAWGSIAGTISAGGVIQSVRSGGNATAAFNGPTVGNIIQNDLSLTCGDIPTVPDTGRADVLAQMAQQFSLVQADRDQFLQDRATTRADLAQGAADAVAGLAASRADQAQAVADEVAQAITAHVADLVATISGGFVVSVDAALSQRTQAMADINTQKAALQQTINDTRRVLQVRCRPREPYRDRFDD